MPILSEVWQRVPERSPTWWRAFVGSLEAHTRLGEDPERILQSIRQQELLSPELGGPRWQRQLKIIETANNARQAGKPVGQQSPDTGATRSRQ